VASSHRDTGVVIGPVRWGVGSVSAEAVRREGNDMTKQRTFKRRVRERMEKTGESYTTARRNLVPTPAVVPADFEPPVTEPALIEASGHGWEYWLAELDARGALEHSHRDIAAWLREERGVPGWYAQAITVGFERARGRRAVGQRGGVWVAGATKTVHVPIERLFAAWEETARREGLRVRTATAPRTARYDWGDDGSRVHVVLDASGDAKSRISLSHERLADADAVAAMKAHWRERLAALAAELSDG